MYTESVLSSAFLAQLFAAVAVAVGLGDWLALVGQLASLALLGVVALKVRRGSEGLSGQLGRAAEKAHEERKAILERLDALDQQADLDRQEHRDRQGR